MRILFLGGSPVAKSRSMILLNYARNWLEQENIEAVSVRVSDFDASALMGADFNHPDIRRFVALVESVDGVVIASPVYKAAYSGVLKALLDLLPERALENKVVLPLMTAGSHSHLLALDYALKPLLGALKAEEIISGVYASDSQIQYGDENREAVVSPEVLSRLEQNLAAFYQAVGRRPLPLREHAHLSVVGAR